MTAEPYAAEVRAYIADCLRHRAQLDPAYHPTADGAVKLIPHGGNADVSDRIRLLADCRTVFRDADALPSTTLVARLRSDPEAPWCEPPPGITPKRLAALLAEYDIRSTPIRFGEPTGQARGYYRADFTDAWTRYCPTPPGDVSQPSQPSPPRSDPMRIKACDTSIRDPAG
jgi:Protein of unknown function (DUF3631)